MHNNINGSDTTLLRNRFIASNRLRVSFVSENSQSIFNDDRLENINSTTQYHCTETTLLSILYNEIGKTYTVLL